MNSLRAGGDVAQRVRSWGIICETYWFPLYAFARRRGKSTHDAEDSVQGFFVTVGTSAYFEKADRSQGKLRTFLLTAFTRYLKDLAVQGRALKRGGGQIPISLDVDQAEEWLLADRQDHEEVLGFERHWAQTIMRSAIRHLEVQASSSDERARRFAILRKFLSPDTSLDSSREEARQELDLTASGCDKAIQRLRQDLRQAVKDLIAGTLESPTAESIHEEMQELQRSLLAR